MPRKPRPHRPGHGRTGLGQPAARDARARRLTSGTETWLHGRHPVEAALLNPHRPCLQLLATQESLTALAPVLEQSSRSLPTVAVGREDLDTLLPAGCIHQGLALQVGPLPATGPEDIVATAQNLDTATVLILDQVTDPHNVGAILRSAAAFGALAVIVQDRHSPEETGTLAKSASGALERIPLVRVSNLVRAMSILKDGGFWIAGLAADSSSTLPGASLSGKVALALGSEGEGLRRLTRENCDILVRLPMSGGMESLNVSNAAAVGLYELFRDNPVKTT